MKALWLTQPWATGIAVGLKGIETRGAPPAGPMCPSGISPLPGCRVDRRERIAICSTVALPVKMSFPGAKLRVERTIDRDFGLTNYSFPDTDQDVWHPLPLGAVVATAVVDDVAPMLDELGWLYDADTPMGGPIIEIGRGRDDLDLVDPFVPDADRSIAAEQEWGLYEPRRWGWLLGDIHSHLANPIPVSSLRPDGTRAFHLGVQDLAIQHPDVNRLLIEREAA